MSEEITIKIKLVGSGHCLWQGGGKGGTQNLRASSWRPSWRGLGKISMHSFRGGHRFGGGQKCSSWYLRGAHFEYVNNDHSLIMLENRYTKVWSESRPARESSKKAG